MTEWRTGEDVYKRQHIQTMITCTGLDDFVNNRFQIDKVFKVIDGTVINEN